MSKNNWTCEICGEGHLTLCEEPTPTKHKGQLGNVLMRWVECDTCGSEFARAEEVLFNKRAVLRFRKQVEGLLTGEEIRAIRKRYNLKQTNAAKLFGGGPVAFSKYEHDDVLHSEAMDGLLRLVQRSKNAFCELVKLKGMDEVFPPQTEEWWGSDVISLEKRRRISPSTIENVSESNEYTTLPVAL